MRSDGAQVKLAPALDGFLYQITETNNIDPLPLEADALLTASVKIADDVSFTGEVKLSQINVKCLTRVLDI